MGRVWTARKREQTLMKYQDFSSDENLVSSEDTIFIFHTVKISLPDFLDKLFTHFKGQ